MRKTPVTVCPATVPCNDHPYSNRTRPLRTTDAPLVANDEPARATSLRPTASSVVRPQSNEVSKRSAIRCPRGCRTIPTDGLNVRGVVV